MGIIYSRFRKKKTTIEVLEELEKKISEIEEYGQDTEHMHKKIVGTLIIYSVALYVIAALVFYFYFFPAKLYDQMLYITPLLLFPFLIFFTKKGVSWYYKRKISKNQEKLTSMQKEKKKILEEVTETETYKKAKEILIKFAPDQLRMTPLSPQSNIIKVANTTPDRTPQPIVNQELRKRAIASSILNQSTKKVVPSVTQSQTPSTPYRLNNRPLNAGTPAARTPLPRPILPQQRSYVDRLVEYVVGDGPNNRYALICRQCDGHNGMSLKEEFEYFAFRCCYCNFWNPARKQKPSAPKLELDSSPLTPRRISLESTGSVNSMLKANVKDSENVTSQSDTDSDIEVVDVGAHKKPVIITEYKEDENDDDTEKKKTALESHNEEHENENMDVDESPIN